MGEQRHWLVTSGLISEVVPILDDGTGPIEEWKEMTYVVARTKRKAIIKGLKSDDLAHWVKIQRQDDVNPFIGVEANTVICEHGYCWCELVPYPHSEQDDYCESCIEEHSGVMRSDTDD